MTKAAILIDGGYLLKRLPAVRHDIDILNPGDVVRAISQLIRGHLEQLNRDYNVPNFFQLLYRCFYYDALSYTDKGHRPISKRPINYAKSDVATFRTLLYDAIRQ